MTTASIYPLALASDELAQLRAVYPQAAARLTYVERIMAEQQHMLDIYDDATNNSQSVLDYICYRQVKDELAEDGYDKWIVLIEGHHINYDLAQKLLELIAEYELFYPEDVELHAVAEQLVPTGMTRWSASQVSLEVRSIIVALAALRAVALE